MKKNLGVSITWLGHATVLYRSPRGRAVLVDAWVDQNPACPEECKKFDRLDVIAITHGHGDHLADCVPLAKQYAPEIVCIYEISLYLAMKNVGKVHGINKGGTIELNGIRFTMVHAIHSSTIHDGATFYPGGEACGYVIEFENGTRVYHAGDTGIFGDMKLIGEIYHPSIAVLPIGDLFTMSPLEASHAARMIGARAIVPIHHSTFPALTGKPAELRERLKDRPDIEVIELKPGETVE
jgi:L-ascorbate metabolism protein UlaG (beta-lactamase superfamily)